MLVAADWAQNHCVVPDGVHHGDWFTLRDWQLWAWLSWYRVRPGAPAAFSLGEDGHEIKPVSTFVYRRAQIVLPQKAGKAPYTSAKVCCEGVGPSVLRGWASGGEWYECAEWGCSCGWTYPYAPGEPMGRPHPTPLIQITAFSGDQTDNIYSALRPMIDDGPLSAVVPKTGETFIRLPRNGRIDRVTSEARSRLGARVTYAPQDETGIWTESAGMIGAEGVADTQRRGLAGMGGRSEETTNAWDPNVDSQASRTAAAAEKASDIFRLHPQAPKGLKYSVKADRRKIHKHVYEGCDWIDLDAIEGEAAELMTLDPAQAQRFFGNEPTAGAGVAFDIEVVKSRKAGFKMPPKGSIITIGVDGALLDDALAMIATDVKTGASWPLCIIERPKDAGDEYRHDQNVADGAMIEAMEMFTVWRVYIDPQHIDALVEKWKNRYGDKRIVAWFTNRPRNMAWAVRELTEAIRDSVWSYNGDETLTTHFAQAQKEPVNVLDDKERQMYILSKDSKDSPRKKDGADAAVLAWKARSDAVELGIVQLEPGAQVPAEPVPGPDTRFFETGRALPAELLRQPVGPDGNPFGSMG